MRNIFLYLCLLLLVAAAPTPLLAQDGPPADAHRRGHHGRGPVEMLLRQRDELKLTDEQVVRLQEIDTRMEERNRPFVQELVAMRRALPESLRGSPRHMTPEQRADFRERMKAARPLMEQIHENNRAAMREVGEVLTPDQKIRVREMLRQKKGSEHDKHRNPDQRPGDRPN